MDSTVLAAQSGSSDAFAALYVAHKPRVMSLCFKMTGDRDKAEDLTQDTFLQLHRKIHTFRGTSQFSTWLYRMTTNIVKMEFRRAKNQFNRMLTEAESEDALHGLQELRPSNPVLRMDLVKAISKLPRHERRNIIKFYIDGLEHSEITRRRGTSKSRISRASKTMRAYLTTKESK